MRVPLKIKPIMARAGDNQLAHAAATVETVELQPRGELSQMVSSGSIFADAFRFNLFHTPEIMRNYFYSILSVALLTILAASPVNAESLTVYFVDVGSGNATLLHQPGKCAMLVDSGPEQSSSRVLRVMQEAAISTLDFVVITHPREDYFGGLAGVAKRVKVQELSDNGDMNEAEEGFENYSSLQFSLPYSVLAKGDAWRCGDLEVDVLHPSPTYDSGEEYNGRALVLKISYNSFDMVLMGDLSAAGERKMLQSKQDMTAMVLQAGMTGDGGSTGLLFDRVAPKIAIVGGGALADPLVRDRLTERNIRGFSVDREGTIRLRVAENGNIRLKP